MTQGLHLRGALVVADCDDGNFGLLDQRVERANATAITGRHAIDFVHDDQRLAIDTESSLKEPQHEFQRVYEE